METRARTVSTVVLIVGLGAAAVLWRCPSAERGIAMPSSNAAPTANASRDELAAPDGVGAVREPVGEDEGEVAESAPWFVRGRVVDQLSRPVPEVMIVVMAESGYVTGRFPADEEGRFDFALPGPGRVRVGLARSKSRFWIRHDFFDEAVWIDPPAGDVELRARTYPHGTLVLRVLDRSLDDGVAKFAASCSRRGSLVAQVGTGSGEIRIELPVESPTGESYVVRLLRPEVYSSVFGELLGKIDLADPVEISEEVDLLAGETREVTLEVP